MGKDEMDSNPPLPDELAPPKQRLDIVATRRWDEKPERWSATITIDGRTIDLGSFSSIGKALYTGAQVYYASTVPPHLRRQRQKLLE
jgi:hypothetical protein